MSHCIQLYVHLNTFGPNFFNQSCSSHFKLQSLCQQKFEYSSNFWRKITAEGHGTEQHLAFFVPSARRFGRQSLALLRHVDDEHRRVLLLTRTPAGCVSSHRMLLQPEPEPLSPCLETTRAAGKAIGRRLCPSTRLFAARSTSSRLCPTLECPARLGCSRPRMETRSASLSPRRCPPLQCLCTTRPPHCCTPPFPPN